MEVGLGRDSELNLVSAVYWGCAFGPSQVGHLDALSAGLSTRKRLLLGVLLLEVNELMYRRLHTILAFI